MELLKGCLVFSLETFLVKIRVQLRVFTVIHHYIYLAIHYEF